MPDGEIQEKYFQEFVVLFTLKIADVQILEFLEVFEVIIEFKYCNDQD